MGGEVGDEVGGGRKKRWEMRQEVEEAKEKVNEELVITGWKSVTYLIYFIV